MGRFVDWLFDALEPFIMLGMVILAVATVVIVFVVIPIGMYQDATAETFDLRKDAWTCTASHEESSTIYVTVGKVLVPSTTTSRVCEQWSRK